jgi:hypothetical protein
MTISDDIRLLLQTRERETADATERARAANAEREACDVHRENLRACGTFECLAGRLAQWEDELAPSNVRQMDFLEYLALPKHRFGTPGWSETNTRICREAVTECWMHTARVLAKYGHVDRVLDIGVSDATHEAIVEPFRKLLRHVRTNGAQDEAVAAAVAELAELRTVLKGACKEIAHAFCLLADAAFPPRTRFANARSSTPTIVPQDHVESAHKRVYDLYAYAKKLNPGLRTSKQVYFWLLAQPDLAQVLTTKNGSKKEQMSPSTFERYLRTARRLVEGPRRRASVSGVGSAVGRDGSRAGTEKADPD